MREIRPSSLEGGVAAYAIPTPISEVFAADHWDVWSVAPAGLLRLISTVIPSTPVPGYLRTPTSGLHSPVHHAQQNPNR